MYPSTPEYILEYVPRYPQSIHSGIYPYTPRVYTRVCTRVPPEYILGYVPGYLQGIHEVSYYTCCGTCAEARHRWDARDLSECPQFYEPLHASQTDFLKHCTLQQPGGQFHSQGDIMNTVAKTQIGFQRYCVVVPTVLRNSYSNGAG